jgi:hypothetical protein
MPLEDQVVSLPLAQKLKELGVKQASAFTYVQHYPNGDYKLESFNTQFFGVVTDYHAEGRDSEKHPMYSAFTVAELGRMLPAYIDLPHGRKNAILRCTKFEHSYSVYYQIGAANPDFYQVEPTEADARAKLLICLIENKLITV